MNEHTTMFVRLAVDLAKQVFQVAGEDAGGRVVYQERISRHAFSKLLAGLSQQVEVVMEVGPGAQAWARHVLAGGATVRILPAQRVAEHRSGAKNDRNDCLAILRAARDQSIHAVPVKTLGALEMQGEHRVRTGYIRRQTFIANQVRGLLLEYDIVVPKSNAALSIWVTRIQQDNGYLVPERLRELIAELWAEWEHLALRRERMDRQLEMLARSDETARRLMTIRGFGPIISTALVAKQTQPERFPNARQFAAYFGLVPDQHSSGSTVRLGRMTRRGDGYIRSLAVTGAQAVLRQLKAESTDPDNQRLQRWCRQHGKKGAAIRLANRNLRIAWVLMTGQGEYHRQQGVH